jgi:N-acetylneuraminic acid mutarotase
MGAILGAQKALESGRVQTEIFNPKTNTWTVGASMRTGRGAPGVQDIGNGKILIVGGVYKTSRSGPDLSRTCELYNTTTGVITSAGSIPVRTAFTTTYTLPGNKVLVAGGDAGPSGSIRNYKNFATKACYIYDAATNSWSAAGALPVATSGGRALTLKDGTRVISGGGDNTLYFPHGNKGVYAFDLPTKTWKTIALMVAGRQSPETIELQAGGIAVIGGGAFKNRADSVNTWELLIR